MVLRNFIYGIRILLKNPGFSLIAIFTLGLGIGTVTSQFSILNGVLFKGLPFPDTEELAHVERRNVEEEFFNAEVPIMDYLAWEDQQTAFESMTPFFTRATVNMTVDGDPIRYSGSFIWHNFEETLKVKPVLGPGLTEADNQSGAPMKVVIGYGPWQSDFNGNPNVIGKQVIVNGQPGTIAGVMPQGFEFPVAEEIWVPLVHMVDPAEATWDDDEYTFEVMGRLAEGKTFDDASLELSTIMKRIATEHPEHREGYVAADVKSLVEEFTDDDVFAMMMVMMTAVFIVLGIACTNVANLLLARSTLRVKEIAIRSALGASRKSIIIQMLTESLLISIAGSIVGVLLSLWAIDAIMAYMNQMPNRIPFWMTFEMDGRVLAFVIFVTVLSGLFSGLIPAFRASKTDVNDVLKESTRGASSITIGKIARVLVIGQIALCFLLLVSSGLLIRSMNNVWKEDFGFDTINKMTARVGLFESEYPTGESRVEFYRQVVQGLNSNPMIKNAAITNRFRFEGSYGTTYLIEGETYEEGEPYPFGRWEAVSPNYFETLEVPLLEGRMFTSNISAEDPREIVVNQSMAAILRESGSGEVMGRRLRYDFEIDGEFEWWTVVGVVPDLLMQGPGNDEETGRFSTPAGFYRPLYSEFFDNIRFMTLIASPRSDNQLMQLGKVLRQEVQRVDPNIPLYFVDTPQNLINQNQMQNRLVAVLFMAFGAIAILLSGVGLYGVISFGVNQRRNEIGVRMALGARSDAIIRMILVQGAFQLGLGLLIGLALALASTRMLQQFLYQVDAADPITFLGVLLFLALIAFLATLIPALRAAKIQPMQALRYE